MITHKVLVAGNPAGLRGGFLGLSSIALVRVTGEAPILFDTGHHATKAMLIAALYEEGLEPADVKRVFLTHLHFDHANNADLFPEAEFMVSRAEWDYAQNPHPEDLYISKPVVEYLERRDLRFIDGEGEIAPGLAHRPAPGHTPGLMMLRYAAEDGRRVTLASDAIKTIRDLMERRVDMEFDAERRSAETIGWIAENSDVILPGHAPEFHRTPHGWSVDEVSSLDLLLR